MLGHMPGHMLRTRHPFVIPITWVRSGNVEGGPLILAWAITIHKVGQWGVLRRVVANHLGRVAIRSTGTTMQKDVVITSG
jgi:hypothetical protein